VYLQLVPDRAVRLETTTRARYKPTLDELALPRLVRFEDLRARTFRRSVHLSELSILPPM
jgi:hypothetical protein